ncbi:yteA family sporulation protein [Halalkalibacterium halodurans]|nr:yteA family sporulation protein [Halalkalibacterium halodurans]MDY7223082.1 yteA family sporulation protein [Halalkalibacterium halodurans]MDY7242303.1 yteA family sporulation protein [Halalkalibacterium halodurans]MED4125443.1 yteA family sporulation protein [Halalkalibacterium halodurans]MED4172008.1 yteA family sporulation protein [Halalkalibacterium halodurans]
MLIQPMPQGDVLWENDRLKVDMIVERCAEKGEESMQQYAELRERLTERKAALEQRLKQSGELGMQEEKGTLSGSTGELSQYDNHPADTATDLYEREKDIALYEQMSREYEEIKQALDRMENGTYGICERTGEQIPYERLEANPTARTTVAYGNGQLPANRPVEEDVLESFDRYNFDESDDETEFDAEDAYQAVGRFNELDMVFEDASLDEEDELIGYVEEMEGFVSTGIEGYSGAENIQFQRNVHYDQYMNHLR